MGRRNDRKHCFALVFQVEFHPIDNENYQDFLNVYLREYGVQENIDSEFIEFEFKGVLENIQKIDSLIEQFSEGWTVSRLSKADLAILRLSVYELRFRTDIPKKVAINEAVELAKEFSGDEAPAFINGILGKVVQEESE